MDRTVRWTPVDSMTKVHMDKGAAQPASAAVRSTCAVVLCTDSWTMFLGDSNVDLRLSTLYAAQVQPHWPACRTEIRKPVTLQKSQDDRSGFGSQAAYPVRVLAVALRLVPRTVRVSVGAGWRWRRCRCAGACALSGPVRVYAVALRLVPRAIRVSVGEGAAR